MDPTDPSNDFWNDTTDATGDPSLDPTADPTADPSTDPENLASLTPYPQPDPTEAPTPIPSSKIAIDNPNGLTRSDELVTPDPSVAPKDAKDAEYDGPSKTGKTLKDLAMELGAPESLGTLIDEMQEALIGIIGDLVNNTGERTSIADILGHENRLRGLGALCILVALIGLAVDSSVGQSLARVESLVP